MNFKNVTSSFAYIVFFLYISLIISSFLYFDTETLNKSLFSDRTFYAVKLSVFSATISTLLAILIAIPSGYALSRYKFFASNFIDVILEIPLIISPAALGAMLLILFSSKGGVWFQDNVIQVIYTFRAIVLAQFFTVLGIATRMIKSTIDEMPRRYEQVARTLGATPLKAFLSVTLPLSKQGLLSAFVLTWAKAFGEFGATFTVAGTMAMKTETIPVSVFMKLSNADISGSIVMIMILITTGISLLFLTRLISLKTKI